MYQQGLLWQVLHNDGNTGFFQRELEAVKSKSYDVLKAPLKGMQLVPVDSTENAGAETITYTQFDMTGIAKVISNYADDLPRADISGKEFTARIKSIGDSYGYSIQDIRAAAMAGKGLQQRKADAALRMQQEKWNRILFYGDAEYSLQGWLTNQNITRVVATETDGYDTAWFDSDGIAQKTPQQIYDDMCNVVDKVVELTNERHRPNRLVMPLKHRNYIARTNMGNGTDTTILKFFVENNLYINSENDVIAANELTEAQLAANGVSGSGAGELEGNVMIAYEASPDNLWFEMPVPFEDFPPQERNLEFVVNCHSRVGGVIIPYPLSMAIMEAI
jgi:hypothetical protein